MTTASLPPRQSAPSHRRLRGSARLLTAALLCCAGLQVQAQTVAPAPETTTAETVTEHGDLNTAEAVAPIALPAAPSPPATVGNSEIRSKATQAAAATLTALLPRLAASDTVPMLDRSAMLAGDLSRLLTHYNFSKVGSVDNAGAGTKVQSVLERALTLIGTPYRWGGTGPEGFDCSGLVGYVFRSALGVELPRVSRDMAAKSDAQLISKREDLRQGDLVFFGRKGRVNHVGIYVGEGRFLHSPSAGKDVRVDTLLSGYWAGKFMQARRVAM